MPEERIEDADASNVGEEEGEEEIPSDIMPLFFTSKTQEIFGCKGDEDVTEENPHKLIPKEAIIQDFKDRAAVSDFHPVKQIVLVSFQLHTWGYSTTPNVWQGTLAFNTLLARA